MKVYIVYSLDYDTYSYSGTYEKIEGVYLSEYSAKVKVLELSKGISVQALKDLKPYYTSERVLDA